MHVFGYGSLVSPASVAATLGRPVDLRPAALTGWSRAWNVGSDRESHPERTFYRGGVRYEGLTVVLGLAPGGWTNGALFPVTRRDLTRLDRRERNYQRIDVTDHLTDPPGPVCAYVPSDEATKRIVRARDNGREMNVRAEYALLVERAFDSVGELPRYLASTPPPDPDMPVQSMEVAIIPRPRPATPGPAPHRRREPRCAPPRE